MFGKVRGALKTFWTIVTHPWGFGSPIPKREKFDKHLLATTGDE